MIVLVTLICKPYTRLPIENNNNNNKFLHIANIDFCFGICDMKKLVNASKNKLVEVILQTIFSFSNFD